MDCPESLALPPPPPQPVQGPRDIYPRGKQNCCLRIQALFSHVRGHDRKPDSPSPQACCAHSLCLTPPACSAHATSMHQHGHNNASACRAECRTLAHIEMRAATSQRVLHSARPNLKKYPSDIHPGTSSKHMPVRHSQPRFGGMITSRTADHHRNEHVMLHHCAVQDPAHAHCTFSYACTAPCHQHALHDTTSTLYTMAPACSAQLCIPLCRMPPAGSVQCHTHALHCTTCMHQQALYNAKCMLSTTSMHGSMHHMHAQLLARSANCHQHALHAAGRRSAQLGRL
jgi:hypothetical protein